MIRPSEGNYVVPAQSFTYLDPQMDRDKFGEPVTPRKRDTYYRFIKTLKLGEHPLNRRERWGGGLLSSSTNPSSLSYLYGKYK